MTKPVFEYNGKLIRDMGDEELVDAFVLCMDVNIGAIRDAILLRMSARNNRSDGVYVCQECGTFYCYECSKHGGASEKGHLHCSENCQEKFNERCDPDETELNKSAWAQSERMSGWEKRA